MPAVLSAQPPARVVALAPHIAELVCAAGGCDRLAAVVAHSDWPPAVRALPQLGDAFQLNVERLLALEPDLVLAWDGGTPPGQIQRLRRLGMQVEAIRIARIADIAPALEHLGNLLQSPEGARAAAGFRAGLADLQRQYGGHTPVTVLYQIQLDPIYTISRRSPIHDALTLCGGINIFAALPHIAAPVSLEAVLARRPQVILHAAQDDAERVQAYWRRWPDLPAVARQQIHAVDADLLARPTPRMLHGIAQVCEALDTARTKYATR